MMSQVFEIRCMMCGSEVGEVRERRFVHHVGCERPLPVRGGKIRCCRCGGSLYMERADGISASLRPRPELARAS
jgi:hypothetical protein